MSKCIFCKLPETAILVRNDLALAFYDKFPVNEGHVLIIPKRHVANFFDLTEEEVLGTWRLVQEVKDLLDSRFHPVAYNVGVNVGAAAGQSVFHAHIHVIPRYEGDVTNPLGGVRNIKKSIVPYAGDGEK